MKRFFVGAVLVLAVLVLISAEVSAARWWIYGTVKGPRVREQVITLHLVPKGDPAENFVDVTSTNKFDQFAFSKPEGAVGPPSAYRLVIYVGFDRVMDVPLDGVRPGGRVPAITLVW